MPLITLREILQGASTASITVEGNSVYVPSGFRPADSTVVIGTLKGAQTYIPSTDSQVISQGYYLGGDQVIEGDANLVGSNILSGVSIFGISGTAEGGIPSNYVKLGYVTVDGRFQPVSYAQGSFVDYGSAYETSYYTISVNSGGQESDSAISDSHSQIISDSKSQPLESFAVVLQSLTVYQSRGLFVSGWSSVHDIEVPDKHLLYVSSGGAAYNVIQNGGFVSVEEGEHATFAPNTVTSIRLSAGFSATAHQNTIFSGQNVQIFGRLQLHSGGAAENINNEQTIDVYQGGRIVNIASNLGLVRIHSGGYASNITCYPAYTYGGIIMSGGLAQEVHLQPKATSGGQEAFLVIQTGIASNVYVSSSARLIVRSGGSAFNVTSYPGAFISVAQGGYIGYTTDQSSLTSGFITISSYHSIVSSRFSSYTNYLSGYVVSSKYTVSVSSGGSVDNISVLSGGHLYTIQDAILSSVTIASGGYFTAWGGSITKLTVQPGGIYVPTLQQGVYVTSMTLNESAAPDISNGSVSGLRLSNTNINVEHGGIANNVFAAGGILVYGGGSAISNTISSGNYMFVYNKFPQGDTRPASIRSTTVAAGGSLAIASQGVAAYTHIEAGGFVTVQSGTNFTNVTVDRGGMLASPVSTMYINSSSGNQAIIIKSGYSRSFSSAMTSASFIMIQSGGYLGVVSSASVDSVVCLSGGSIVAVDGGKLTNVVSMPGAIITDNGSISYV